jgi:predicted RNA-binding protein Jag
MGAYVDEVALVHDGSQRMFDIRTKDSALLIGNQGERLKDLNYVVKRIVERALSHTEATQFLLDVNGYQRKHVGELRGKALMHAERVRVE